MITPQRTLPLSVERAPERIRTFHIQCNCKREPVKFAPEKIVGIDCEMVEANHSRDVLARVAIVTRDEVLYKSFVLPCDISEITEFRTDIT